MLIWRLGFVLALAACAASHGVGVPVELRTDSEPEALAAVALAQQLADAGDPVGAIAVLEAAPRIVEAQRLRQDLLRQRGRLGALRREAQAAVAKAPQSASARYLLGRVQTPADARRSFEEAVALDRSLVWPWLGLAFSLRQSEDFLRSLGIYQEAYAASQQHEAVAVGYANALRGSGRIPQAIEVYEALVKRGGTSAGIGHLGIAQARYATAGAPEDRAKAWNSFLMALRERPFDAGAQAILREVLRSGVAEDQVEQCLDVLREDPARWRTFLRGAGVDILATMLPRMRQPQAALAAIESVPYAERSPQLAATRRLLLLSCGDARAFHAALLSDLPRTVLDAESNQARATWNALLLRCEAGGDPIDSADSGFGYAKALRDVGMLAEAEVALDLCKRRHGARGDLDVAHEEVRKEIAFENALRRALYRGYAKDEPTTLDAFLAQVRTASVSILGRDVVDPDVRFSAPLVGEMLDPFESGLCRHLARYNRHLVLGRRAGGVPEGMLFTRLSIRDLEPDPNLPTPGRCREVLGIDRSVRSLSGVLGGDVAGIALMNHYIVDYDAVVEWAQAIVRRQSIVKEDGGAALSDPLPESVDPMDPLDSVFRTSASSSWKDGEVVAAVLESIQIHERRHMVDSFYYMPVEKNLWRAVSLLVPFGFSAFAIESEMERRAELAALAYSKRPEVVLAHIAEFISEKDEGSPHVRGFTQLARDFVDALLAEGVPLADAAVSRWDRLDGEVVRRAARRLVRKLP